MLIETHQADELPHINMTPMVDVVLCLLVFFMAATRLYDWDESQFIVNVPEVADAAPLTSTPEDLTLTIVAPGKVAVGDEDARPRRADRRPDARPASGYADQGVLIRGEAKLSYQDLADVLAACDAAGIRNVRLPVRPREPAPRPTEHRPPSSHQPNGPRSRPEGTAVQEYLEPILNLLKPEYVIAGGYLLMTVIVFAETGLLIGFCLPGDSLLVTAGIFAARGELDIVKINAFLIPAAILGDTVGYWIGYHSGPRLFRARSRGCSTPSISARRRGSTRRHGGKTIILARFMPIVRTFAPVVAGMGRMNYRKFLLYNVFGGIGWVLGMSLAGYGLGLRFPGAIKHLEVIIIIVVLVSIAPDGGRTTSGSVSRRKPTVETTADLVVKAARQRPSSEPGSRAFPGRPGGRSGGRRRAGR